MLKYLSVNIWLAYSWLLYSSSKAHALTLSMIGGTLLSKVRRAWRSSAQSIYMKHNVQLRDSETRNCGQGAVSA